MKLLLHSRTANQLALAEQSSGGYIFYGQTEIGKMSAALELVRRLNCRGQGCRGSASGANDTRDPNGNNDDVAYFSSRGPTAWDGLAKPDLVSPGDNSRAGPLEREATQNTDVFVAQLAAPYLERTVVQQGQLALQFSSRAQRKYRIESTSDVVAGPWNLVQEVTAIDSSTEVQLPINGNRQFYRINLEP